MDFERPVQSAIPGVQGEIFSVLAATTAELNLRTIADLAGVSVAQTSRVLAELVKLGVVTRREAPPSALFRLERRNLTARAVVLLADSYSHALDEIGHASRALPVEPAGIIVFGSFARREADADSDIDVVLVRPGHVEPDDDAWSDSVESWRDAVHAACGNPIHVVEIGEHEIGARLRGRSALWQAIRHEGVVVAGPALDRVGDAVSA